MSLRDEIANMDNANLEGGIAYFNGMEYKIRVIEDDKICFIRTKDGFCIEHDVYWLGADGILVKTFFGTDNGTEKPHYFEFQKESKSKLGMHTFVNNRLHKVIDRAEYGFLSWMTEKKAELRAKKAIKNFHAEMSGREGVDFMYYTPSLGRMPYPNELRGRIDGPYMQLYGEYITDRDEMMITITGLRVSKPVFDKILALLKENG